VEGQLDLFGMGMEDDAPAAVAMTLPDLPEFTAQELMSMEKETTGLYLSGHPMDAYREAARRKGAVSIGALMADFAQEGGPTRFADEQRVTVAGIISRYKTKTTRNNSLMAYVTLEDDTGAMELLVFSRTLGESGSYIRENSPVIVSGKISVRDEKEPQILCDTLRPITDTIQEYDDGFYRMEKTYFRKTNDNFSLQIKGLSCSTSTLNRDTIDYLRSMGYASRSHWSRYLGGTPVNDSLLGIKYLITDKDMSDYYGPALFTPEDYGYPEDFSPNGNYDVYFNEFALSFAYGVADGWLTFDYNDYDNPYERLNAMITVMLGETETVEVFKPAIQNGEPETVNIKVGTADGHHSYKVDDKTKGSFLYYDYTVPEDTELFFFYPNRYLRQVKLSVNDKVAGASGSYASKGTFGGGESNCIVSLGESTTGNLYLKVEIDNDSNNLYVIPKDSYIYYIDMEVMGDAFTRLGEKQLLIDSESTDSHIFGTVTTDSESQLMFTSIPYDEGWNVYVDGEKVEIHEANNALVAFYVEGAGEHEIELKYMPATVALGITVSITCLVIFVLILIAYPFVKKVPYLRRLIMIEGEELPPLATAEYRAGIEEGDIGAPVSEPTPEELIAEASAAKYGKVRSNEQASAKKPTPKQAPQGQKPQSGGQKGGKK
jgi:hypothetical protein